VPDTALESIEQALLEGTLTHGFATDQPGMRHQALTIAVTVRDQMSPVAFAIESPPELGCRMPA